MKKLLTLFLLSFLAVNILAQDRSALSGTDFYAKMQAAKDAERSAQVQFDDCFPAVSYPPVCDACGTYRVWLYEDFDCWSAAAYCDPNLAAGELGTIVGGWVFNHAWNTQFINLYDQRLRNLDVADTTTFNNYDNPVDNDDKYSWWLGGNWPSFNKPGYDDWWGVYVETQEVLNLQPGLDQASINFFSWYALEPDVDYVWLQISPREDILDDKGHNNWYFVDKLFDEVQQRYGVDLYAKYPIDQYTWGNETLADIENTAMWDPSVFPEIKRPQYNETSVDLSFLVEANDKVIDYFKNVEGYGDPQFFKFRWLFVSDAGNSPATSGYFNGRPGGFWMDEITLLRDGFPQLVCDGGDIRLGLSQALYYQEDNFYWNSYYTSRCDDELLSYYIGGGNYWEGKGDTDYLDNTGANTGGCGDIIQGGSHKLANGHLNGTTMTEWLQWPLTVADVFNPGGYDPSSTEYLYNHGTLAHPFTDFDSKARDWDVNCNTSSPITMPLYENDLYGYDPSCGASTKYSLYHPDFPFRKDWAMGPIYSLESLENYLDPGPQNIIRNEYHRWCASFDFKTLGWETNNDRGPDNLDNYGYVRDYFAIYIYSASSSDKTLLWKSGNDKSTAGTSNLDAYVDADGNTVGTNGWVRSAQFTLPNWIYTNSFYFVVEYYTNPNPWRGKLFVDNFLLWERWDTYEGTDNLTYTTNDTPALARGAGATPDGNAVIGYDASDPCDEIPYITTCVSLHPEPGGLNYPVYDEDWFFFEGEEGDWVDIWVDNSDVDLELYLMGYDNGDPATGNLVVLWDPLQGGQFAFNDGFMYDRIIWELPYSGEYFIFVGASQDLPNWKAARGWYTLKLHGTKVAPAFIAANDVANDQGLQVRLEWCPSYFDTKCAPQWWTGYYVDARIEKYVVWREVVTNPGVWDNVAEVYSGLLIDVPETYSFIASTLKDGLPFAKFRVSAHMFDGYTFFSEPISAVSFDNLAPEVTLDGTIVQTGASLLWQVDIPDEIETYKLYRSLSAGTQATADNFIGEFSKSTFTYIDPTIEPEHIYYYVVEGLDDGGNKAMSNEVPLSTVGLQDGKLVPTEFNLAQNYPNPFNPTTVIKYALPTEATVTVKVFDVLGQEVMTLVNSQVKNAGYYTVNFDASNLKSGMYIYRIAAQGIDGTNFVDVKKMLLVK
ncbi:MAG: T9SS type A sorting domain-containing protein [bacterium]